MKQIAVCPCDIPEELREGLAQLCENEGFCLDAAGLPLYARRAEHYRVQRQPDALRVEYDRPVQFFRALSLLAQRVGREKALALLDQGGALTLTSFPCSAADFQALRSRINRAIAETIP